jgi:hypothetical protein
MRVVLELRLMADGGRAHAEPPFVEATRYWTRASSCFDDRLEPKVFGITFGGYPFSI